MKHFRRALMIRLPPGIRWRAEDKSARKGGGVGSREQKYSGGGSGGGGGSGDKIARLVLN